MWAAVICSNLKLSQSITIIIIILKLLVDVPEGTTTRSQALARIADRTAKNCTVT